MYYRNKRGINPAAKIGIIAATALVGLSILKSVLTGGYKTLTDAATTATIKAQTGADTQTILACQDVADKIHGAIHGSWKEDFDTVVSQMSRCKTPFQVRLTSQLYLDRYGVSLKRDVEKYHNFYDPAIPSLFKSNWS